MHKVIFDTDPGVDDAMALLFLIRHPEIDLIGITTTFGNASIETTTRNARFLKREWNIAAPIAQGNGQKYLASGEIYRYPTYVHGEDGLGNIDVPANMDDVALDPRPAHQFIIDTVKANPGEVTIVAVGRMTNLAMALAEAPEVAQLAQRVVIMGGAFGRNGHYGNVTPVAEANIWGDPAAADIVFGAAWPVTILPLDVTHETVMSDSYVNDLAEVAGEDGRFVREISRHYQDFYKASAGIIGFPTHDSSAVVFALHPEFYTTETGPIRVVSEGLAFGQTIIRPQNRIFPPGDWDNRPNQTIVTGVNAPAVLDFYRRTLLGSP